MSFSVDGETEELYFRNYTKPMDCCLRFRVTFEKLKPCIQVTAQILHFFIVMAYLWAGLVEFIDNPPFFDAYGDAISQNKLPEGIFKNDPNSQSGILRLMDLPILILLLAYFGVTSWLRYQGLAWLLTIFLSLAFVTFWVVNFWAQKQFDWKYYSSRMSGLELQVSTLALAGTVILSILFYKRRKMPFKFKSSLPIKVLGTVHIIYNFCCIFLIMFASMLMWFTKMYISWACFKSHKDLMQICQITSQVITDRYFDHCTSCIPMKSNVIVTFHRKMMQSKDVDVKFQVQCYACHECTTEGLRRCYKNQTTLRQFSCNTRFPKEADQGAFCIFNYNMSVVEFLTIFAYIGGLCVFLSTFIRLVGHYSLRAIFIAYERALNLCDKSSETLQRHREYRQATKALRTSKRLSLDNTSPRELLQPGSSSSSSGGDRGVDIENGRRGRSYSGVSDSSYSSDHNFLDASCG